MLEASFLRDQSRAKRVAGVVGSAPSAGADGLGGFAKQFHLLLSMQDPLILRGLEHQGLGQRGQQEDGEAEEA